MDCADRDLIKEKLIGKITPLVPALRQLIATVMSLYENGRTIVAEVREHDWDLAYRYATLLSWVDIIRFSAESYLEHFSQFLVKPGLIPDSQVGSMKFASLSLIACVGLKKKIEEFLNELAGLALLCSYHPELLVAISTIGKCTDHIGMFS